MPSYVNISVCIDKSVTRVESITSGLVRCSDRHGLRCSFPIPDKDAHTFVPNRIEIERLKMDLETVAVFIKLFSARFYSQRTFLVSVDRNIHL